MTTLIYGVAPAVARKLLVLRSLQHHVIVYDYLIVGAAGVACLRSAAHWHHRWLHFISMFGKRTEALMDVGLMGADL